MGNQGSVPKRGPEKQSPHPRQAAAVTCAILDPLTWEEAPFNSMVSDAMETHNQGGITRINSVRISA